jgi:RNA polymerase sigma factor (sigma-70 family)
MPDCTWSDEKLLETYYGCDDSGFEGLYRKHQRRLIGLARKCLGSSRLRESAEDVFHDAFAKLVKTKREGSSRWRAEAGLVKPWLNTILCNNATNLLRKAGAEWLEVDLIDADREENGPVVGQADDEPPPDERARVKEERERLRRCIDRLPEQERLVVVFIMNGLKQTEIATMLRFSDAKVTRIKNRAFNWLIRCMAGEATN